MIYKNDIPCNWETIKISDAGKLLRGVNYKKKDSSNEALKNYLPILRATNIKGDLNFDNLVYVNRKNISNEQLLKKDDIVFAMSSGSKHLVGKTAKATTNFNGSFGAFCAVFRPNENFNKEYIAYFFQSPSYKKFISEISKGTNINNLKRDHILNLELPLPPLPEQHLIVEKIEKLFTDLDKGIEILKTAQQQLKVYRQAVLKWAFEGKLTNTKFESVITGDVINPINNGYTPKREFLSEGEGEIPFIKIYNLNFDGTLNYKKNPTFIPKAIHIKELKRSICYPGDVLINIVGPPLGKVSIVTNQYPEWNINQAIVMFRPNENIKSKYLSFFFQNHVTIQWLEDTSKATAGQWNIKVSTCRNIPFPLCSLEEQDKIVQEIEARLSVCDKIEETITNSLKQSEALRQSILKRAFEGKLIK